MASGGKDIGDGGGFFVKICKLSVRQSPCCLLDFCVLLPVRIKHQDSRRRTEAAVSDQNSLLAGDSMRVGFHGGN